MAIGIVDAEGAIVNESLKSKKDCLERRIGAIAGKRFEYEKDWLRKISDHALRLCELLGLIHDRQI